MMEGGDRTIFMVSHSERNLRRFCTRGLYVRHGEIVADGSIEDTLDAYNAYMDTDA